MGNSSSSITNGTSSKNEVGCFFSASKEQCWKVYTCLGIVNQIISFFSDYDSLLAQQCNVFCYNIAVGRSNTRITLGNEFIFSAKASHGFNETAILYRHGAKIATKYTESNGFFELSNQSTV